MGTLATWSSALLWISLVLQVTLLVLVIRRRLAGEIWSFAGILLFYAARSIVLHEAAGRMPHEAYGDLYSGLSLADLMLQLTLAGELLMMCLRRTRERVIAAAGALVLAAALTALLAAMLPARSLVPADRGTIFTGVLFAILFGIAVRVRLGGWARAVATGLAIVGTAGVLSECGKSLAVLHRDGAAYVGWSYGNAACYLGTLGYWIVVALRLSREGGQVREAGLAYARGTI